MNSAVDFNAALAQELELSEASAYESLLGAPSTEVQQALGLDATRLGEALALKARAIPNALNLNRVIGLGVCEPITAAVLDEVLAHYAPEEYALEAEAVGAGERSA